MIIVIARNVNHALPVAMQFLSEYGYRRGSRNGEVVVAPEPVTTVYDAPQERVLFHPQRDANPFFHLMESLWMLHGGQDVEFPARYVKRMHDFSDDGETFNGAYGYRWRHWFGHDQLREVIKRLRSNPEDRRVVLGIWDPSHDATYTGRDAPCNLTVKFTVNVAGCLDMIVFNRSNDVVWGAYGANAVHFSVLQEYIAAHVGVPLGRYWQISCDWHAYSDVFDRFCDLGSEVPEDPYASEEVAPLPLVNDPVKFDSDLRHFMRDQWGSNNEFLEPFFRLVAAPMERTHHLYRTKTRPHNYYAALHSAGRMYDCDWKVAAQQWLERRLKRHLAKKEAS